MASRFEKALAEFRNRRMSDEEKNEQRISFAYGNTKIENDLITREMVIEEANALALEGAEEEEEEEEE